MIKTYHSIDKAIGDTPLVEIRGLNPSSKVRIFAKLEYFNPRSPRALWHTDAKK